MISLCLRTDKPISELYIYRDDECLAAEHWEAHRSLAETIHHKIDQLLTKSGVELHDIEKIIVFRGPGSFTGLRIGLSVANALGYALQIPVLGIDGDDWLTAGLSKDEKGFVPQMPLYGSEPHITQQKK